MRIDKCDHSDEKEKWVPGFFSWLSFFLLITSPIAILWFLKEGDKDSAAFMLLVFIVSCCFQAIWHGGDGTDDDATYFYDETL